MIDHVERIRAHFADSALLKQEAAQSMADPIARAGALMTDCLFADGFDAGGAGVSEPS